jgi:tRNA (guanine-N1)-methyltransferase
VTGAQRIAVVTLFPEIFQGFLQTSLVGQAAREGLVSFAFESPREHGLGRHRTVDDTPYGGGSGMVAAGDQRHHGLGPAHQLGIADPHIDHHAAMHPAEPHHDGGR